MLRSRDAPASAGAFWRFQKEREMEKLFRKALANRRGIWYFDSKSGRK